MLTKLSFSCNIMRYLGYVDNCAVIYKLLNKKSYNFWKENEHIIGLVLFTKLRDKRFLAFKDDFSMKHAEMLLGYNTYLLFNVKIKLQSSDGYRAFTFFLEKVSGLPEGFFIELMCTISLNTIEDYNRMVLLYLEKGGKVNTLTLTEEDEVRERSLREDWDYPKLEVSSFVGGSREVFKSSSAGKISASVSGGGLLRSSSKCSFHL